MGNTDTKLNFRKAIVQLGNKDQVKLFSNELICYFYYSAHRYNFIFA